MIPLLRCKVGQLLDPVKSYPLQSLITMQNLVWAFCSITTWR